MEIRTRITAILGRRLQAVVVTLGVTVCAFAVATSSAAAANFTWSGAAASGESKWSNGTNWEGSAPGGSVGMLTFPKLTSPACNSEPPTATCFHSSNDVAGLSVGAISIAEEPEAREYVLGGKSIVLGGGGITATAPGDGIQGFASVDIPITLGGPQTWSVDGGEAFGGLAVGPVGGSQALKINLAHRASMFIGSEVEAGAVSIEGANGADTGPHAFENGEVTMSGLNAAEGSPVGVTNAALGGFSGGSATVGALTSTGGAIGIGGYESGTLTVNGAMSLDSASFVSVGLDKSGTTAGMDYGQVSASGPVTLAGSLELAGVNLSGNVCPTLNVGDVDTVITTTGALSGQFANVPEGQLLPVTSSPVEGYEGRPRCATARINYTAHSVTATIVSVTPPPTNISPPSILGNAWAGQTLTAHNGTWIDEAEAGGYSGFYDLWEDCDAAGNNCTRHVVEPEPTYTLSVADVGHTVRMTEFFFNVAGSSSVTSAPTGVVTSSKPEPKLEPKLEAEPKLELTPRPEVGKSQGVKILSGTVTVRVKGSGTFVAFSGGGVIPDGSEVDATNGRVLITVATTKGGIASAEVYGGRFRVHQDQSGKTVFILTLPLTGCTRVALPHGSAAVALGAKHSSGSKSRHLWVAEKGGSWGTNGRYVSTSVEGTTWLTLDECNQSEVKVTAGKVQVRDLVRNRTKAVAAGRRYIASRSSRRHSR